MSVFIFSKKETALKTVLKKNAALVTFADLAALPKHHAAEGDLTYLDLSGLNAVDAKKAITQLKKRCKNSAWGLIDPKGSGAASSGAASSGAASSGAASSGAADIASLFFEGASDYMGPDALKTANAKRFKTAASWRIMPAQNTALNDAPPQAAAIISGTQKAGKTETNFLKTGIQLPAGKFPGWKNLPSGKTMNFYLLHCSLQAKTALPTLLGEAAYTQMYQKLLACLRQYFHEAEGLVWIDTGTSCLLLIPPKIKCVEAAVKNCLRLLISAPLVALEILDLKIPVNLVFALHYGPVRYCPPGKTGTVVSDAVNFVFHLGAKKAEAGRLTISGEIPDGTVPAALENCFVPAGNYEGRSIWQTRKFSWQ